MGSIYSHFPRKQSLTIFTLFPHFSSAFYIRAFAPFELSPPITITHYAGPAGVGFIKHTYYFKAIGIIWTHFSIHSPTSLGTDFFKVAMTRQKSERPVYLLQTHALNLPQLRDVAPGFRIENPKSQSLLLFKCGFETLNIWPCTAFKKVEGVITPFPHLILTNLTTCCLSKPL